MNTTDTTIVADHYEFSLGRPASELDETITHLAFHMIEGDQRFTLAMTLADAEQVGKLLVSHADYVSGRPPREW